MAKSKNSLKYGLISLAIVAISNVIFVLDWALPLNFLIHPVLTLVLCLFAGFGVLTLVISLTKKSPLFMILSAPLVALAIMYVLLGLFLSKWWISICVMVVVFLIYVILGAMIFGNKTEEIAENDSPEYKNYQERKEEKKILEENQLEPELPKLKSFKK